MKSYENKNNENKITERRWSRLKPVSDGIKSVEKEVLSGNEEFQFWLFRQKWKKIVGEMLAKESYIARKEGNILWIYAQNAIWMQELIMQKEQILKNIQKDSYGRQFQDLRIMMSPAREPISSQTSVDGFRKKYEDNGKALTADLTDAEENWIRQFTEKNVTNDAIREPFRIMMENALKNRKAEAAAGLTPCKNCGRLCDPKKIYCDACRLKLHEMISGKVVLLLKQKPELLYEEVKSYIHCDYDQYRQARDTLIHRYKEHYFWGETNEEELSALLALLIHKAPELITKEETREKLSNLAREKRDLEWIQKKKRNFGRSGSNRKKE